MFYVTDLPAAFLPNQSVFLSDLIAIKYWVLQNQPQREIILSSIVFAFPIIHNLQAREKGLFWVSSFTINIPRGLQLRIRNELSHFSTSYFS